MAAEGVVATNGMTRLLIEQRLEHVGAQPGPVDRRFDHQTREAIRWFQGTRDIPVTGYVSERTMLELMADQ